MKNVILLIDTSDNSKTVVGLVTNTKKRILVETLEKASQNVLPLIDKILHQNNIKLEEISGIQVNTGPGSYTGLRVSIAIANGLGMLLKIPINDKKVGTIIVPKYIR